MGLRNMEGRVSELGGRLAVITGEGQGTKIEAVVPDNVTAGPKKLSK